MTTSIRLLTSQDAEGFKNLRLGSLEWDPDSWLSSMEEEKDLPTYSFANKLSHATSAPIFGYWGLFENDKLLAYAQIAPSSWNKKKHIVHLYDVCVDKNSRRKSVGTTLIKFIINEAKKHKNIEVVNLYVTSNNKSAINFYEKLGFQKTATLPNSVKEKDGRYQDELLYSLKLKS